MRRDHGVLVDSEPIINRAHAEVLTAGGYPITERVAVENHQLETAGNHANRWTHILMGGASRQHSPPSSLVPV
jgi:beta-phosphoglucomutase-like phosphatase (HAD superfamily)